MAHVALSLASGCSVQYFLSSLKTSEVVDKRLFIVLFSFFGVGAHLITFIQLSGEVQSPWCWPVCGWLCPVLAADGPHQPYCQLHSSS